LRLWRPTATGATPRALPYGEKIMALDALRSGFIELCIDPSLNYYSPNCRIIVEGALPPTPYAGSTPPAADTVVKVPSAGQAIAMFGNGVLAAALAKVLCACPSNLDVYALPRTPTVGNVAAVYSLDFTGSLATGDGNIQLFLGDENWITDVTITNGMTATQIVAAVATAIGLLTISYGFPYAVTAYTTGDLKVTLTAIDPGSVGNYLNPVWNYTGQNNLAPPGVTMAVTRTTAGAGAWTLTTANAYAAILQECCYDAYVLLTDDQGDAGRQGDFKTWLESQWSCNTPQCFGHGYVWNSGTLGQILATGNNAAVFNRLAFPVNDVNPPYLLIAEYAALSACIACTNPETNIQGETYGILSCTYRPMSCSQPWHVDDRKQLSAAGFVTWGPATRGSGVFTNPMIYEDITNYLYDALGRPNVTFRSTNMRRWAKSFAASVAAFLETTFDGLSFFDTGTTIKTGVRASTPALAYARILAWLRDQEGTSISQIADPTTQVQFTSDMDVAAPCRGVPGKYYLRLVVGPPVRIAKIVTTLLPKLITNCNR
jgi:phage tail sheath gpL-like